MAKIEIELPTEMVARATEQLIEQVTAELKLPDPSEEKAQAAINAAKE